MVRIKIKNRKGVAMIELIFAIVIMGFVMLSIPMLMMQVKHASKLSSKQESIAMIASQMNLIMTHQWDDIQTRVTNDSFVVSTAGSNQLNVTGTMRGARTQFQNTRVFSTPAIAATNVLAIELDGKVDGIIMDDVDDYNNFNTTLLLQDATPNDKSDYIDKEVNIATSVNYVSYGDNFNGLALAPAPLGAVTVTTNIKEIIGVLTTANTSEMSSGNTIRLRAFSSNIGGYDVETREGI